MSTDSTEPVLGAALREAREAAGRTVEQLSSHTKIRATLIRDLESDRFASSGGAVYARGHLKSIASALVIDPAPFLKMFDEAQGQSSDPVLLGQEPLETGPVTSFGGTAFAASAAAALTPERRGPRWGVALSGAAAVLLVIIGIGSLNDPAAKTQDTALAGVPTATPTESSQPAVQTPNPEAVASKPPVTGAQLRLRLIGGDSWVSISSPSATLFTGVLHSGDFKDFSDPTRLKVVVGNALAVNLNCGGRDSGPAGASGKVRRFACTAAGLAAL